MHLSFFVSRVAGPDHVVVPSLVTEVGSQSTVQVMRRAALIGATVNRSTARSRPVDIWTEAKHSFRRDFTRAAYSRIRGAEAIN